MNNSFKPRKRLPPSVIASRIVATMDKDSLHNNYRIILRQARGLNLLPMIKADGYGHGAGWVAQSLVDAPRLEGFGVATLSEAITVRKALGSKGTSVRVLVFSGMMPWDDMRGDACARYGLTPILASEEDWRAFSRSPKKWWKSIPFELKFNTGMNRLGIDLSSARRVVDALRRLGVSPTGVLSHLALGERPSHPLSIRQKNQFKALRATFEGLSSSIRYHLGNSAAIWNSKEWDLESLSELARPGLSLYGIRPWPRADALRLQPVMTLRARILQTRTLRAGEGVGYGAAFRAGSRKPISIATLGAGYADGIPRILSRGGSLWGQGEACPILGWISMDLLAIKIPSTLRRGQWVEIIGRHQDLWAQAKIAKTIPYELLTSVSPRVERYYVGTSGAGNPDLQTL